MVCNDLILRLTTRVQGPTHASMNACIIPRSIFLVALNGFFKLDLDIVVRPVKLYKTTFEVTLIPLSWNQAKGGKNETTCWSQVQNLKP
jgi:hypothetical protein